MTVNLSLAPSGRVATFEKASHGVWLDKDITTSNNGRNFFRGALDEVHIFNASLTLQEIRTLMKHNATPD